MTSDKLFVVAIDFGTTYSGYAFSNIHHKDEIFTYNWIEGISQAPKTPTSILFTPQKSFQAFGYEAEEFVWIYFFMLIKESLLKTNIDFAFDLHVRVNV
jgi:hypothetical protein